jgi:hypothetical protein
VLVVELKKMTGRCGVTFIQRAIKVLIDCKHQNAGVSLLYQTFQSCMSTAGTLTFNNIVSLISAI